MKSTRFVKFAAHLVVAALCLGIAPLGIAAETNHLTTMQANTVARSQGVPAAVLAMPDLELILDMQPTNPPNILYPFARFGVRNIGKADSSPTTLVVTCTAYKIGGGQKSCLSLAPFSIPALPAPKVPNDPNSVYGPQQPWTPGAMPCSPLYNASTNAWEPMSYCVIEGTLDPGHQVNDSNRSNNVGVFKVYPK